MADQKYPALKSADDFIQTSFDYLIVGGGTAGLVIAARLSEDPNITVGVLEAGAARLDDPQISLPAGFAKLIMNPEYDWMMQTVPQTGTNDLSHSFTRGKCLGGSSAINLMMYIRGQAAEYNDWAALSGYEGWGWEGMESFFFKHETMLDSPGATTSQSSIADGKIALVHEKAYHGTSGPIQTSFPSWIPPFNEKWHLASRNSRLKWIPPRDAWSGNLLGGFHHLSTIDRRSGSGTRSYSVTGYLAPNANRQNLHILTEATVEKLIIENEERNNSSLRATGVQFSVGGKIHTVNANKEVILSAGTVQTPQLLELSGIGDPRILNKYEIKCLVPNTAVGDHLEDHILTGLVYDLAEGEFSLDRMASPEFAKESMSQYMKGEGGPLANSLSSTGFLSLADVASEAEMQGLLALARETIDNHSGHGTPDEEREILIGRLTDPKTASLQLFLLPASYDPSRVDGSRAPPTPGVLTSRVTVLVALTHPFSRGSIHICSSSSPPHPPAIDPGYLSHPLDVALLSLGMRVADRVFRTSPLKERIHRRVFPPPEMDLESEGTEAEEERRRYVRGHARTEYHPIGTAGLGRVVDGRLKVKGVRALRVVDASVMPMQVSGNIMAPVYALAEKGAEFLRMAE